LDPEDVQRGVEIATGFIAYRMRSEFEIRRRLKRANIEDEDADAVIERLTKMKLVDDRAFAGAYARDQIMGRKRGPLRVRRGLAGLGVSKDLADEAVSDVTASVDMFEQALDLGRKRWRLLAHVEDEARRRKRLYDFLVRRGYDFELVRRAVEHIRGEDDDE
jgi:regulatory protein